MGAALVGGLLASASSPVDPAELSIVEVVEARREVLKTMFPTVNVVDEMPNCAAAVTAAGTS